MRLSFLGATGSVTGSRYLLECGDHRLLIDCGLFQGFKQLRLRNWAAPSFDPRTLDAVILTHAHIDHSGYIPRLVNSGFAGPVFCTDGTLELCRILLPDSGHLQEEDARFANRHGFSKHRPALPLYTREDAIRSLRLFRNVSFDSVFEPMPAVQAMFSSAGHIADAASLRIEHATVSVAFSGDLGRPHDAGMNAPAAVPDSDYLVVESTYGDRLCPAMQPEAELAPALKRACVRNAVIVIPTFAVGCAQALVLHIARLKAKQLIPDIPVYLDSPMAIDATLLYEQFAYRHRSSEEDCRGMYRAATRVNTSEESKQLATRRGPMVILAASGMATGGRVVHHLKNFAPDARNMIVLSGYQAPGTRGGALAQGAKEIRIHGQSVEVRAEVVRMNSMSAHADANELVAWMESRRTAPRQTFITHAEPAASDALRIRIERELRWDATVPDYRDEVELV